MCNRIKFNLQEQLDFTLSNLKITNEYFMKFDRISQVLNNNPKIVEVVHRDLIKVFGSKKKSKAGRKPGFSTETILRILIIKQMESLTYRDTVIRIDDSIFLREFVGIGLGKMMDFTMLCNMFKAIRPETWKRVNDLLTAYAIEEKKISGDELRRDTTVYEANIHYATDSHLLWDTYRVLARFIEKVREVDPALVGNGRLKVKKVKSIYSKISRNSSKSVKAKKRLNMLYKPLIAHIEKILIWSDEVCDNIRNKYNDYTWDVDAHLQNLLKENEGYILSGIKVVDQASRRVFENEKVPNVEKIFSIFEPHTELIVRGKAGKQIEFGHMINIQQVKEKFITGYDIFLKRPVEYSLVDSSLAKHKKTFGSLPKVYADDKGAYQSMEKIYELENEIEVVSICKKGKRNQQEQQRESDPLFKLAQKFRAGIEGSISFLKRTFGLNKCYYKGWESYQASVGQIIFCHNLTILTRE